jgi:hypothetical protein
MIIDFSTQPFDLTTLVFDKELVAQELFRIVINAGILDFLNETVSPKMISDATNLIQNALSDYEGIEQIANVEVKCANELLTVKIVAVLADLTTLETTIDVNNLTVDFFNNA